jgi:vacuolar-type H+-ATPase subunit E/Vma4
MTNEEMLKDIKRMNAESIESIKRSKEIFRELSKEVGFPVNDIEDIIDDTLKIAEENLETVSTIIRDNAYHDAMDSVIPKSK